MTSFWNVLLGPRKSQIESSPETLRKEEEEDEYDYTEAVFAKVWHQAFQQA